MRVHLSILLLMLGTAVGLRAEDAQSKIRVVNHHPGFLNGIVVSVNADDIYKSLNVSNGVPLIAKVGGSLVVPAALRGESIDLLLSLRRDEDLDVVLTPAERWAGAWISSDLLETQKVRKVSNGLLSISIDDQQLISILPGGATSMAMVETKPDALLNNIGFSGWLDMPGGASVRIDSRKGSVSGTSVIQNTNGIGFLIERDYDLKGVDVKTIENLFLPAGVPEFEYTAHIENQGKGNLYLRKEVSMGADYGEGFIGVLLDDQVFDPQGNSTVREIGSSKVDNCVLKSSDGMALHLKGDVSIVRDGFVSPSVLSASLTGFRCEKIGSIAGGRFLRLPAKRALATGYRVNVIQPGYKVSDKGILNPSLPITVYLDEKVASVPVISSFLKSGFTVDKEGLSWLFGVDVSQRRILSVEIEELSEGSVLSLFVKRIDKGPERLLCSFSEKGKEKIDFSEALGDAGGKEIVFSFRVTGAGSPKAYVSNFFFGPPIPDPPELVTPNNKSVLTDIAAQFSWKIAEGASYYDLQVARDAQFSRDVMQKRVVAEKDRVFCFIKDLRGRGKRYWRVRSVGINGTAGAWSDLWKVTLSDDYRKNDIGVKISSEKPILVWDITSLSFSSDQIIAAIPKDLRSSFVLSVGRKNIPSSSEIKILKKHDASVFLDSTLSLSEIEWAFQNLKNIIGVSCKGKSSHYLDGESSSFYQDGVAQVRRLIPLCARYGKYFMLVDGNRNGLHWQRLCMDREVARLFRKYSEYIIVGHDFSVTDRSFTSLDQTMGMMLDGMVSHMAVGADSQYWKNAGIGVSSKMPSLVFCEQFIQGMARGADVLVMTGDDVLLSDKDDIMKLVVEHIVPFWRSVVDKRMIPSRNEVLGSVKAMIVPDLQGEKTISSPWDVYQALYKSTYLAGRKNSVASEFIPNTGRYYFLPILPYDSGGLPPDSKGNKANVHYLNLSRLQTDEAILTTFGTLYPVRNTSEAWLGLVGNKFYITNTHENKGTTERFSIDLRDGFVRRIQGRISPHMYIMGKVELSGFKQHRRNRVAKGGAVWLQCDAERYDKNIEIIFDCNGVPEVEITPRLAHLHKLWKMAEQQLIVVVSARAGPVQIRVSPRREKE